MIKTFNQESNESTPLSELVDFQKGKPVDLVKKGGRKPYIGAASFNGNYSDFTNDGSGIVCEKSDILLLWDGANAGRSITNLSGIVGSTVARLRPKNNNNNLFIHELLSINFKRIQLMHEGSGVPHLPKDFLSRFMVPNASLVEQEQIVEILSDADSAVKVAENLAKALRKNFAGYRNQIMKNIDQKENIKMAFGEFVEIPIFEAIKSADNELSLTVSLHCKGVRVNEGRRIKINPKGRPYSKRKKGDFLIGRQNIHNGGFGFVPAELNGCIASNAITSLRLNPSLINDRFFIHYFTRPNFYRRLEVLMGGTGQKEIGENELMRIKIPVPDMEKQNKIADKIDTYLHMAKMQENLVSALKKQKRGLMQKLLTGKLRIPSKKRAGK